MSHYVVVGYDIDENDHTKDILISGYITRKNKYMKFTIDIQVVRNCIGVAQSGECDNLITVFEGNIANFIDASFEEDCHDIPLKTIINIADFHPGISQKVYETIDYALVNAQ